MTQPIIPPWIETYTGKHLYFLEPKPDQIDIEDIATALSNECRFSGHTKSFYSVAEHSILVATICPKELALEGLLHDASEAYLRDIATPIKQYLDNYKELEEKLMDAIFEAFNLEKGSWKHPEIKEADVMALKAEARTLLPSGGKDWVDLFPTKTEIHKFKPHCFAPTRAKDTFIQAFKQLTGGTNLIIPNTQEQRIILAS